MRSLKKRWPAQLISAAMALVLICASAVGAYAHGLAHCHHGHAHASQPKDFGAMAPLASGMEHKGEPQKTPAAPAANHADCCDTICHGGYAVVGQVSLILPLSQAKLTIPVMRADAGVEPYSLDRPPRSRIPA
jgi:hypothetical protein